MSEIKPVAYTSQIDLDRVRKGKDGDMYGSPQLEGSDEAVFTVPLYTADQLSEAVAAERERWSVTVANALNWLKHGRIANARDDLKAAQRRAVNEAIRSAAK